MPNTPVKSPQFGDPEIIAQRAQMYVMGFRDEVYGPGAADWIRRFCEDNTERAHELSHTAQAKCVDNDEALAALAGRVKYINAHLELAACYGKQIGIMSEHEGFRQHALSYVAVAYAELEGLEYFEPVRAAA